VRLLTNVLQVLVTILARWNYFNTGDPFSEWHRQYEGLAFIDIDFVEICKKCKDVLAVGETAVYKGHYDKKFRITQRVAESLKVLGFLIFYELNNENKIVKFRYRIINPVRDHNYHILEPNQFVKMLHELHLSHEKFNCKRSKK